MYTYSLRIYYFIKIYQISDSVVSFFSIQYKHLAQPLNTGKSPGVRFISRKVEIFLADTNFMVRVTNKILVILLAFF